MSEWSERARAFFCSVVFAVCTLGVCECVHAYWRDSGGHEKNATICVCALSTRTRVPLGKGVINLISIALLLLVCTYAYVHAHVHVRALVLTRM